MQRKSILKGALILTIANIITRILGFVYRVYMANVIGAEGMGLYQLVVPIYMLVWSISASGFSTTISKLTAQENAKREYGNMGLLLKQSMITSGIIAAILGIVLFLYSEIIGTYLLKDIRTIKSLKIISLCFPFMALGSCIRGYFFGLQETQIPAISQVLEQTVRMITVYLLASTLIPMGIEYACVAAVSGMALGEVISFLYVLFSYRVFKLKYRLNKKPSILYYKCYSMIIAMAIPLTANRVTGSFLSTIENILIPQKLQAFGLSQTEAMSTYGKISAMAMPLIMFPSSLLTALSTALVPAVSEAKAIKNSTRIKNTVTKTLLITSIIGIGSSGLFITFSKELGTIIYNQPEIGNIIYLMGFICPFIYLQVTLSGVLNGLGEQVFIFRNSLISSAINIGFIYFFIPEYGVNAFIVGWFISLIIITFLDVKRVILRTNINIDVNNCCFKPLICIILSSLMINLIYKRILLIFGNTIGIAISISILGIIYIMTLILTDCINFNQVNKALKTIKK